MLLGILPLRPCERLLPVHALAAVGFRPHEPRGAVGDRAVLVVEEVVFSVVRVPADAEDEEGLIPASAHLGPVALDAPIGEVDPEHLVGIGDVRGARGPLRVDRTLAGIGIAVGELEESRVEERGHAGGIGVGTRIHAAEEDERVEFLDCRETPVSKPCEPGGVEPRWLGPRLGEREFVVRAGGATVQGGAALPNQARDVVLYREAVGVEGVGGRVAGVLRILPVEWITRSRWVDFLAAVVALHLPGPDDGIVRGGGELSCEEAEGEKGEEA